MYQAECESAKAVLLVCTSLSVVSTARSCICECNGRARAAASVKHSLDAQRQEEVLGIDSLVNRQRGNPRLRRGSIRQSRERSEENE